MMGRVRSARDIDASLRRKGFSRVVDGKHVHFFLRTTRGGKLGVSTLMSHGMGGTAIGDNLLSLMSRQLHLSKVEFLNLVDCTLTETEYRELLTERGVLEG
ncbi:MAG: hypothetical protein ACRC46_13575 [Thermoguttaceae bacterium]